MPRAVAALVPLVLAAAPALAQGVGQEVYMTNCSACHQAAGVGIKGAFPALAGDAFVRGDPAAVIGVVLNGRGGMPRFSAGLNDVQIAAAVSYIRQAWGNGAAAVTPAEVGAIRAGAPPAARGAQPR